MIYLFCLVDVINMQDSFVIIFHYVSNCEICLHYWVQMSILEHFAFRGEKLSYYSDHLVVTFCSQQTKCFTVLGFSLSLSPPSTTQ